MTFAPTLSASPVRPRQARLVFRDLADVPLALFDDDRLERALSRGLGPRALGATWVRHRFEPRGMSLVCLGTGVRAALHTWPERSALSLDLYGTAPELEEIFARCLDALLGHHRYQ
ncbi:MAG TPA: S-adenosylmethionine decarboxylase [Polyangiaceae bacterium]